jgi:hypothetical protein
MTAANNSHGGPQHLLLDDRHRSRHLGHRQRSRSSCTDRHTRRAPQPGGWHECAAVAVSPAPATEPARAQGAPCTTHMDSPEGTMTGPPQTASQVSRLPSFLLLASTSPLPAGLTPNLPSAVRPLVPRIALRDPTAPRVSPGESASMPMAAGPPRRLPKGDSHRPRTPRPGRGPA